MSTPSSSKYLCAEERRAMTVASVLALAAKNNPAEITTVAIAAHMGLSQAAIFRHFPTKDALWQEVLEWVEAELMSRVKAAAAAAAGPLLALEAVFLTHIAFAQEYPGVPRMLFGELQRTEITPAKRAVMNLLAGYRQFLTTLLQQGKQIQEIRAELVVPVAVSMFVGLIQGLVMQMLMTGKQESLQSQARESFLLYRQAIVVQP